MATNINIYAFSAIELMAACRYAQHPIPNLHERKLNAISTLPGLMIVDDDPMNTGSEERGQKNLHSILNNLRAGQFNPDQRLYEQEVCYIAVALKLTSGNISEAARQLGINRTTLHSRMDAHEKLGT